MLTTAFANNAKIYVLLDRYNYSSGEVVHGYILVQNVIMQNKTMKLEVRNVVTNETVYQSNIKIINNESGFYIPVLPEIKSGTYLVDFFVCTVENVTTRFVIPAATTSINIINNTDANLIRESFFEKKISNSNIVKVNQELKTNSNFLSDEKKYQISFSHSAGDSIKLIVAGETNISSINIIAEQKNWNQAYVNSFAEKIFQKIKVSDDKDQKQFGLLGLYTNDADKMFISKSDAEGSAIFLLDDYQGLHSFNLFAYQNYSVKPMQNDYSATFTDLTPISDIGWNQLQADASESRKRDEIHHYFEVNTFGLKSPALMKKSILPKPFWSYNPSNYKKFPDLQTFCKENELELRFNAKKEGTTATLSPPPRFTNAYDVKWENPFFLIDGKAENDYKKIASIKPDDIAALYIYYDKKEIIPWLYAFGSNGVVVIETKINPNPIPTFRLNGFQNSVMDGQTIISEAKSNGKPVLIPTLYWKSNIEPNNNSVLIADNSDTTKKNVIVFYINENNMFYSSTELTKE